MVRKSRFPSSVRSRGDAREIGKVRVVTCVGELVLPHNCSAPHQEQSGHHSQVTSETTGEVSPEHRADVSSDRAWGHEVPGASEPPSEGVVDNFLRIADNPSLWPPMPEEIRRSLDLSQREQQDLRELRGLLRRGPDVAHELAAKDSAEVAQEREQRQRAAELLSQQSRAEVQASNLSV